MEQYTLARTDMRPLAFTGDLLASVKDFCRELKIYRIDGALIFYLTTRIDGYDRKTALFGDDTPDSFNDLVHDLAAKGCPWILINKGIATAIFELAKRLKKEAKKDAERPRKESKNVERLKEKEVKSLQPILAEVVEIREHLFGLARRINSLTQRAQFISLIESKLEKISSAEVSEFSTIELLGPAATEDRKDQRALSGNQDRSSNIGSNDRPPSDSEPNEHEAGSGEGHYSDPVGPDSPIRSYDEADEKPETPLRDFETSLPQRIKDAEKVPNSISEIDGSSQSPLPHSHHVSPKKSEPPSSNAIDENSNFPESRKKPKPNTPRKIGSRRRRRTQSTFAVKDVAKAKPPFTPRPELICRKASWRWEVVLAAADECKIKEVRLNGESLKMVNSECCLSSLTGNLSIFYEDGEPDQLQLFNGTPLIFKLNKDWTGDGRRVPRLTKGHFIVIAPVEQVRCGHVQVEPDGCSDTAFIAHYFFRDGSESTEEIGGFSGCEIDSSAPGFELRGKRVFDDSEQGELFVGPPPQLTPANRVVWARVGEERIDGWPGENFEPSEHSLAEVLEDRQGRFFVRVYDRETKLVDSGVFRYLQFLRKILVNGEHYSEDTLLVPPATGHPPTTVQFISVHGVPLHPIPQPKTIGMAVGKDSLVAKPYPNADEISCTLEGNGGRVEITLHLPRIWWRLEEDDGETSEWRSTPFQLTRPEFREHADSNTLLRLRLPKRVKAVSVGFGDEIGRKYAKNDEEVVLPLDDFVDYSQIDRRLTENALFNIRIGQKEMTLIKVLSDPPPKIDYFEADPPAIVPGQQATLRWTTRNVLEDVSLEIDPEIGPVEKTGSCEVYPSKTTTYTLRLTVLGKEHVKQPFTVTVQAELGPGEKRIVASIILDLRRQEKTAYELIEDVINTLRTMDAQVVKRVDLGHCDLPREINGNSTSGRNFKLTLHAPTRFAKRVRDNFHLEKILDDRDHNLVIFDRPEGDKFCLDKTVCRILLQ